MKENIFTEEQLVLIRDIFGDMCYKSIESGNLDNAQEELDIINVIQRHFDYEEYVSIEQFRKDDSGTWDHIHVEEEV